MSPGDPTVLLALLVGAVYLAIAVGVSVGRPLHCKCPHSRVRREYSRFGWECRDCGAFWPDAWTPAQTEREAYALVRQAARRPRSVNYRPWHQRWRRAAWMVGQGLRHAWREL